MHKHSHWIFRRNYGNISTHTYIYQLLRHAKRSNLQWPGCWTSGQTFGILNARFGSGTRYSLQTSSPNTGVEWQSALRGVFFLRSLWPIFLFGTIFCLWNEPAIGNLPHFGGTFTTHILPAVLPWPFIFCAGNLGRGSQGLSRPTRAAANGNKKLVYTHVRVNRYM